MKKILFMAMMLGVLLPSAAETVPTMQRSAKRGMCDNGQFYSEQAVAAMAPGVSWTYNWAVDPTRQPSNLGGGDCDINFAPMCWNGYWNATALTQYLSNNPGTRYLLGFNEPNFSSQANMTPAEAAEKWPQLEAYAEQYGTELVSPALNFSGENVGGRVWQPVDWLDAFIKEYNNRNGRDPRIDYIALHCYMDYAGAVDWYVNRYLYVDNYNNNYPNLKRFFDEHGKTPLLLTEFCAWENNYGNLNADFQVQSMVEKLQVLELSENVAGYCWFMAHGNNYGYPYYRIFESNADDSPLTRLGTIYVYSSAFDRDCYFATGMPIMAKDYIYMANVEVDLNTDDASDAKVELRAFNADDDGTSVARYQVDLPKSGYYTLTMRVNMLQGAQALIGVKEDGDNVGEVTLTAATSGWQTLTSRIELGAGRHTLELANVSNDACRFNWFQLDYEKSSAIDEVSADRQPTSVEYYNMQGQHSVVPLPGIDIVVTNMSDGTQQVSKRLMR